MSKGPVKAFDTAIQGLLVAVVVLAEKRQTTFIQHNLRVGRLVAGIRRGPQLIANPPQGIGHFNWDGCRSCGFMSRK